MAALATPVTVQKQFAAKVNLVVPATEEGGDPEGTFEAIVSVFGNEDAHGDIVEPGAFTKTLAEWIVKGNPIPVVWSHAFNDPDNFLGYYSKAEETEQGLRLKGHLDLAHSRAARIYQLMKQGLINEFSWSGEITDYEPIEDDDHGWWYAMRIKEIDLWEAGPCFKGANPDTELVSVKTTGQITGQAFRAKAGRVLSQKNVDALREARDAITEVLKSADAEEEPAPEGGEETEAEKSATKTVQRASAATQRALSAAIAAGASNH